MATRASEAVEETVKRDVVAKERREEGGRGKSGRMRGLPRGGEESGGCGRRRVQIITIIIFPGNMAAERGWPRSLGRVGGKRG